MDSVKKVRIAFEQKGVTLTLEKILPRKQLKADVKTSSRYRRIVASIRSVGIVEPPLVFPQDKRKGEYLLLDGHLRLEALRELGESETFCLIATDDEAFTYNHHVCAMNAIQEHFMISRAIASGVSKERIAQTLGIDERTVREKQGILVGVCSEAVELLKDKPIARAALRQLRVATPMRQIEIAELMVASNNFSAAYVTCLVAATPVEQLTKPLKKTSKDKFTSEDLAKIEREVDSIGQGMRSLEETHGRNVLNLVIVVGYLKKLLANVNVVKYLARKHPELLSQFQKLVEATSLDGGESTPAPA